MGFIKRYMIAGLLVWLPLGITVAALIFLINLFDRSLLLLPSSLRPEQWLGQDIPGLGIILSLVIIFVTGMLVANIFGRYLFGWWEKMLSRIPLVRSIYLAVKQISEALFGEGAQTFQKAYLIEYPRKGLWTVGFQTSKTIGEAQIKTGFAEVVNVFVPTTPNPTSGFFLIVDRDEVFELDMTIDDALKMVISGGVVVPPWPQGGLNHPIHPERETQQQMQQQFEQISQRLNENRAEVFETPSDETSSDTDQRNDSKSK
ncbi:DUF502 domain-containing protein [Hydrogenovibrio halophilus]|uniref:DUF502 domain-containing protein n=1 Tax=Hydrogenovibrio halophilus TaxID=373391 RepID=UPI0003A00283|nr:DUF502 domain-containing protein [Hydrogenovibrio halophilus]